METDWNFSKDELTETESKQFEIYKKSSTRNKFLSDIYDKYFNTSEFYQMKFEHTPGKNDEEARAFSYLLDRKFLERIDENQEIIVNRIIGYRLTSSGIDHVESTRLNELEHENK